MTRQGDSCGALRVGTAGRAGRVPEAPEGSGPRVLGQEAGGGGGGGLYNHVTTWLGPLWLQKLTNVRIMKENMQTGNLPANMKKARVLQIIPCTPLGPQAGWRGGGRALRVHDHPPL